MENDVLTTSQAAKLLGISVRTAQLLVEGGSLRSWKTPGGHRRVYRDDVLALMKASGPVSAPSPTNAVLLASPARMPAYERHRSEVGDIAIDAHSDEHAAAFAIGARLPAAIILDLGDQSAARLSFARQLSSNPSLGHTRLVTVGPSDTAAQMSAMPRGHIHIASPDELPDTLRAMFAEPQARDLNLDDGFPVAANEAQRLAALERSGLVGTLPEPAFDRLTWLASQVLQMPVSLMTLLTPNQQWFKSRQGLDMTDTPRNWAFCNQTILQRDVFEIDDLAKDARFGTNPAVAGAPHFRFYAGAPVIDPDGYALGSVCVMDYVPRNLDQDEKRTLLALAAIASDEVRLRTTDRQLRWIQTELERSRTRAAKR